MANNIIKKLIPSPLEIGREAIIVVGGAALAAIIVSQLPAFQKWIKESWGNAPWL